MRTFVAFILRCRLRIFLTSLLLISILSAESNTLPEYNFKRIGLGQSLSDITVNCIQQDYMRFVWIGTAYGLNRYDGYEMVSYFNIPGDSTSLMNNEILCLYEDNRNRLWIGTSSGINLYIREADAFKTFHFDEGFFTVFTILQDKRGEIWVGTVCGLYKYSEEKEKFQRVDLGKYTKTVVRCLFENYNDDIWIGTERNGILVLQRDSLTITPLTKISDCCRDDFLSKSVRSICTDQFNNYWIASYGNGVAVLDKKMKQIFPIPASGQARKLAVSFINDRYGKMWIGTDGNGVMIYDPVSMKIQTVKNDPLNVYSLSSDAIRTLFEDIDGNIWVGTYKGGLNLTSGNRNGAFQWYTHNPLQKGSLSCNNVTAILEDVHKTLWVGTDGGGLDYRPYRSNSFCHFNLNVGFDNILSIYQSGNGALKFGSFLNGYCEYNVDTHIKSYINSNDWINGNYISGFADFSENEYVAVNGGGINLRNMLTGSVRYFQQNGVITDSTLSNNFIHVVYKDNQDNLWIGTYYGLCRLDMKNNKILSFYPDEYNRAIKGDITYSIIEDNKGYMWFGTNRGLSRLDIPVWKSSAFKDKNKSQLTFTNYSMDNKQPVNIVYSIIQDKNGDIWLGTNMGLIRFNIQKQAFSNYLVSDGITEPVFNPSACSIITNGKLLFGTQDGLIEFDPDSIHTENTNSRVIFTGILINYKPFYKFMKDQRQKNAGVVQELMLSYRDNTITFRFVSPGFYFPDKIKYACKLDHFDESWIETSSNSRMANYTNLPPGTYEFMVKATTPEGKWSDEVRSLRIIITPPVWETWWFIASAILIVILLIYGFIHLRMMNIRQQKKKLEILVDQKTMEVLEEKRKQLIEEEKNRLLELKQKEVESEKLRIEKELIVLRNEKLKALVERKNTDIDKKSAELALNVFKISSKNKMISKVASELKIIADKSDKITGDEIQALILQLNSDNERQADWRQFENYFDHVHEKFFHKLNKKFPNLSLAEKRLCAYLKMNLSSKEIAGISNITSRSVETERTRLRKKLGLNHSESLIGFINDI